MKINKNLTVTYTLMILCIAVCLIAKFLGLSNANSSEIAIFLGAYYKPFILAGQWWRLFTNGLIHIQLLHLFMNMLCLYILGTILEVRLGHLRYLILIVASIIGGASWSFILDENVVAVGISGGLYGLLACYILLMINDGGLNDPLIRSSIIRTILINLCINFMPGVSYNGHIGGAITGLLVSLVMLNEGIFRQYRIHSCICLSLFIALLGYFCMQNATIPSDQMYKGTDYHILQQYQQLGLDDYAVKIAENLDQIYGDHDMTTILKGDSNGQKIY